MRDPSGAVVPSARVTATSLERGQSWRTDSDGQGRYVFLSFPVGAYDLRVEHPPFRPPSGG